MKDLMGGDLRARLRAWSTVLAVSLVLAPAVARGEDAAIPVVAQAWAMHAQTTLVDQATAAFASSFRGPNSLDPAARGRETFDASVYLGVRPWGGGEVWFEPELDQGFGLSDTLGVAGFPSGEAYKVGRSDPYLRVQRLFLRQTLDLGGTVDKVEAGLTQLAGAQAADRLVVTVGKMSVGDVFDTNTLAHDPRADFLNWTLIDTGTFDYAADAWGYTIGAAAEWYVGRWTLRGGVYDLSGVPNSGNLDKRFHQYQAMGELEERHTLWGRPGAARITGYLTRGRMGRYLDAVALAEATGQPASIAAVRHYSSRGGIGLDVEQQLTPDLSAFGRAGWADGRYEAYEFTDVDRTIAGGLSLKGGRWGRADDTIGLAGVTNQSSSQLRRFLRAGGLGILIGDGRLPAAGDERILETYYSFAVQPAAHLTLDYQCVDNPGYNRARGPASVFAARVHLQY